MQFFWVFCAWGQGKRLCKPSPKMEKLVVVNRQEQIPFYNCLTTQKKLCYWKVFKSETGIFPTGWILRWNLSWGEFWLEFNLVIKAFRVMLQKVITMGKRGMVGNQRKRKENRFQAYIFNNIFSFCYWYFFPKNQNQLD